MEKTFEERLAELNKRIGESKTIVFFSGAGVSTDSGIPDFRSKDGLYNNKGVEFEQYSAEYLLSHTCLTKNPKVFFEFYRQKLDCRNVLPNATHLKMAELEHSGKDVRVITQNIDGLHEAAGSSKVRTIHGTTRRNYCVECGEEFVGDRSGIIFESEDEIPKCPVCGGMIRPDVILYEEPLAGDAWTKAVADVSAADLFIVCGSSLTVQPAASLAHWYATRDKLVIINRDKTVADSRASLVFHEELKDVFAGINVEGAKDEGSVRTAVSESLPRST